MRNSIIKLDRVLRNFSRMQIRLLSLAMVTVISLADLVSGNEFSISIFFLVPVAISTWYCNRRTGVVFSVFSAILWFVIDYAERTYSHPTAPYWNTTVRLGFFLVAEELLSQLKVQLGNEQNLARTDALTGLLNVRGFTEQAEMLFGLAARRGRPVVLAYIDLDNFKKVNDERGHSEGDKVLRIVSDRISSSLRVTDVAGRMGGDEFAIVLPEVDEAGARIVIDTLRRVLLREAEIQGWPISFSIGVVSFDTPSSSLDEAISIADALMYQVKESGKDNIIFRHHRQSDVVGGINARDRQTG